MNPKTESLCLLVSSVESFRTWRYVDDLCFLSVRCFISIDAAVLRVNFFFFQAAATSTTQQSTSVQEPVEDTVSQDSNVDNIPRTPPPKSSALASSPASTPVGGHASPLSVSVSSHNLPGAPSVSAVPSSIAVRGVTENAGASNSSSPVSLSTSVKEEELASFPGRRPSPSLSDAGLVRGIGRGGLSAQIPSSIPLSSSNVAPSNSNLSAAPLVSDVTKRNILGADERIGSSSVAQPLVSPLSNRLILPQAAKASDGSIPVDSGNAGEAAAIPGRAFSPSMVSSMQWRPGSSFQNQNEAVCYFPLISFSPLSLPLLCSYGCNV